MPVHFRDLEIEARQVITDVQRTSRAVEDAASALARACSELRSVEARIASRGDDDAESDAVFAQRESVSVHQQEIERQRAMLRDADRELESHRSRLMGMADSLEGYARNDRDVGAAVRAASDRTIRTDLESSSRAIEDVAAKAESLARECRSALGAAEGAVERALTRAEHALNPPVPSGPGPIARAVGAAARTLFKGAVVAGGLGLMALGGVLSVFGGLARSAGGLSSGLRRSLGARLPRWGASYPSNLIHPTVRTPFNDAPQSSSLFGQSAGSGGGRSVFSRIFQPKAHDHAHGVLGRGHAMMPPLRRHLFDDVELFNRVQVSHDGQFVHVENQLVSNLPRRHPERFHSDVIEDSIVDTAPSLGRRFDTSLDGLLSGKGAGSGKSTGGSTSWSGMSHDSIDRLVSGLKSETPMTRSWMPQPRTVPDEEFFHRVASEGIRSEGLAPPPGYEPYGRSRSCEHATPYRSMIDSGNRYYRGI